MLVKSKKKYFWAWTKINAQLAQCQFIWSVLFIPDFFPGGAELLEGVSNAVKVGMNTSAVYILFYRLTLKLLGRKTLPESCRWRKSTFSRCVRIWSESSQIWSSQKKEFLVMAHVILCVEFISVRFVVLNALLRNLEKTQPKLKTQQQTNTAPPKLGVHQQTGHWSSSLMLLCGNRLLQ